MLGVMRESRGYHQSRIGRASLITVADWDVSEEDSSVTVPSTLIPEVQQQLLALPPFESVKNWVKDLSALKNFTFMDLYTYLIESKDKKFDHKSLRTFISLKAYSYFKD